MLDASNQHMTTGDAGRGTWDEDEQDDCRADTC